LSGIEVLKFCCCVGKNTFPGAAKHLVTCECGGKFVAAGYTTGNSGGMAAYFNAQE
jgi:hypothetical protein